MTFAFLLLGDGPTWAKFCAEMYCYIRNVSMKCTFGARTGWSKFGLVDFAVKGKFVEKATTGEKLCMFA